LYSGGQRSSRFTTVRRRRRCKKGKHSGGGKPQR
jgi:hypothetical protein